MLNKVFFYKSRAKVNLFLHVLSIRDDGYHNLESLVYFPEIYDELFFSFAEVDHIVGKGDFAHMLPETSDNLIFKVINYFKNKFCINSCLKIEIAKNLPIGGGVGGGSSNAALSIIAMNDIFELSLTSPDMLRIASKFGADVAICLLQESLFFHGIGDNFFPVSLAKLNILLVNFKEPLLTKDVFRVYDRLNNSIEGEKKALLPTISTLDLRDSAGLLNFLKTTSNDLSIASISINPHIGELLISLEQTSPLLSRMSGSGSTCFAVYSDAEKLSRAASYIRNLYPRAWIQTAC